MDFIHVRREVDLQILAKKDKKEDFSTEPAETIYFNVSKSKFHSSQNHVAEASVSCRIEQWRCLLPFVWSKQDIPSPYRRSFSSPTP